MGIQKKSYLLFLVAFFILSILFFVPAGTLDYWQAWLYLAVLFFPAFFVVSYFLRKDPEFLKRRLKTKEKEAEQRFIIKLGYVFFSIGFILPGLDHRFGWSQIPTEFVIFADIVVLLGYYIIFLTFKENSYACRTVEVEKGQKVISTGPYSVVRHPMYVGVIIMYLATPIALGSFYAFPIFLSVPIIVVYRLLNEEKVLLRDLPGYEEYCQKVRYHLIPHIW